MRSRSSSSWSRPDCSTDGRIFSTIRIWRWPLFVFWRLPARRNAALHRIPAVRCYGLMVRQRIIWPGARPMTVAQKIAATQTQLEFIGRVREFVSVCRYVTLRRNPSEAVALAEQERAPDRVVEAIRAATDPISIAGSGLAPFQTQAAAFFSTMATTAVFD